MPTFPEGHDEGTCPGRAVECHFDLFSVFALRDDRLDLLSLRNGETEAHRLAFAIAGTAGREGQGDAFFRRLGEGDFVSDLRIKDDVCRDLVILDRGLPVLSQGFVIVRGRHMEGEGVGAIGGIVDGGEGDRLLVHDSRRDDIAFLRDADDIEHGIGGREVTGVP